jgi:antitoxin (DNA-binding transcriptional repressor) of toxin-antitoxin stability system
MTRQVTLAQIEEDVAACLRSAEGGDTVLVTRNGKPVVAMISAGQTETSDRRQSAPGRRGLAALAGGWEGSDELVERIAESRRTPGRPLVELD